jgi:hypothetical protein
MAECQLLSLDCKNPAGKADASDRPTLPHYALVILACLLLPGGAWLISGIAQIIGRKRRSGQ